MTKTLQITFMGTLAVMVCLTTKGLAQINSGSDGNDGEFNPTTNTVIDMTDHPDGIYQYTSVNIPVGVTVSFIPNANNTPVTWLVQSNCVISGSINLNGQSGSPASSGGQGGVGGPGGWAGGNAGSSIIDAGSGFGPGGGQGAMRNSNTQGGDAGFGSASSQPDTSRSGGAEYGNIYLLPLIGGSGGGGSLLTDCWPYGSYNYGGGGGGGAICIAVSGSLNLSGSISSSGGGGGCGNACGSGGAIRLVASTISGSGTIIAYNYYGGGYGRVRIDAIVNNFLGSVNHAIFTQGFQPIIIPAPGQQATLSISSIAGISVPPNTSGSLLSPDVIIPGQQANPIPVVVQCSNIPLNTTITVQVNPTVGATVTAVGMNTVGTQASSTATIPVNMPHGGGVILAQTVIPISFASLGNDEKYKSLAKTGLTTDGERFAKMELTVTPAGKQQIVYLTASGKRYPVSPF